MFLPPGHPACLESILHRTTGQGLLAGVFQLQHHGGHLLSTLARDFLPHSPHGVACSAARRACPFPNLLRVVSVGCFSAALLLSLELPQF